MLKHFAVLLMTLVIAACSKDPRGIQFGQDPAGDLQKYSRELSALPPDDIKVMKSYLEYTSARTPKDQPHPAANKIVEEILRDAKVWNASLSITAAAERLQKAEEARVAAKIEAERKFLRDKVAGIISVSYASRTMLPDQTIQVEYDIQNKSGKPVLAVKGRGMFTDAAGKTIVDYPLETDKTIAPGGRVRISVGYKASSAWREMASFAQTEDGKFSFSFKPEALILEGGEVLNLVQNPAG